jgi:uncharacterized protein YgiM (DUF1202 family)
MKRKVLALVLLAVVTTIAAAAPLAQNEAFVLLNGLALWQDDKAKLTWMENLAIGDRVTLLNRTSKFKQDGQDRDFVRIKAPDGKEGWVRQPFIASKASLAVVKADQAVIYSEPREVKITSRYVSSMTIVAVLQDGSTGSYAKIQGYDRAQKTLFTDATFVSVDDLTISEMDINAVILYTVAVDDPKVKNNLLKLAMTKYGGSIFLPNLQAAAGVAPVAARDTRPATGAYLVNDDNVNVRSTPDEKSGQVVGKLNTGAQVDVTEMTSQTYTVGNSNAAWFHIKNPDGWVFGSFLEPVQ